MAEMLDGYTFDGSHGNAKYPWRAWTNGETWRITKGDDFEVEPRVMQKQIKVRGGKDGLRTVTRVDGDAVIFTFQAPAETEADFHARTRPKAATAPA